MSDNDPYNKSCERVNPIFAKLPMKWNGGLAKLQLTPLVTKSTEVNGVQSLSLLKLANWHTRMTGSVRQGIY